MPNLNCYSLLALCLAVATITTTCVASAAAASASDYGPGPCDGAMKSQPWCDTSKSFEDRAAAIVSYLTPEEKSGLLVNGASDVKRVDWPKYNFWSEALHGVARDGLATSFPQICGVASSLNRTLFHLVGNVTGNEARGMNNGLRGNIYQGLTMWAPNIVRSIWTTDIARKL